MQERDVARSELAELKAGISEHLKLMQLHLQ